MLNVMLSMLLAVAQALLCAPGCLSSAPGRLGSDAPPTTIPHEPGVAEALAGLGHAALEIAFSGVVQVAPTGSLPHAQLQDC